MEVKQHSLEEHPVPGHRAMSPTPLFLFSFRVLFWIIHSTSVFFQIYTHALSIITTEKLWYLPQKLSSWINLHKYNYPYIYNFCFLFAMLEIKPRVLCILDMTQSPSCTPRTSLISFFTPNGNFSGRVSAHWGLQRHFHCFELTTLDKQTSVSTLSVLTRFCRFFLSLHWERPLCWTSPTVLTFSSVKEK